jgi:hypothetical protein
MSMHYFTAIVVKMRVPLQEMSSLKKQVLYMILISKHNFHAQSPMEGVVVF